MKTIIAFLLMSVPALCFAQEMECHTDKQVKSTSRPWLSESDYVHVDVTVGDFDIWLKDGSMFTVSSPPQKLDLTKAMDRGKGLLMNLIGVLFPNGADSVDAQAVQTKISSKAKPTVTFRDGMTCDLKLTGGGWDLGNGCGEPGVLSYVDQSFIDVILKHDYQMIKAFWQPHNSLKVYDDTLEETTTCCPKEQISGNGCKVTGPVRKIIRRCELWHQCLLVNAVTGG